MMDKSQQDTSSHTIVAAADMASADEPTEMKKPTLFTLPREIRDIIYEYACDGVEVSMCLHWYDNREKGKKRFTYKLGLVAWRSDLEVRSNVGILNTCKQMRAEAQGVYYRKTIFSFGSGEAALSAWLRYHVPITMLGKIKNLRVVSSRTAGQLQLVRTCYRTGIFALAKSGTWAFQKLREESLLTLELARARVGPQILSKLEPGTLQVEMVNEDCEIVWTPEPLQVQIPTHEDLVKFDNKHG